MARFPKSEHLYLRSEIDALFTSGSTSASVFPIRGVFRSVPYVEGPRVKVLVSVSKRHFRLATDRNRIKRLMREHYRLKKTDFISQLPEGVGIHIGFLWLSDKMSDQVRIENSISTLLNIISDKIILASRKSSVGQ
ncbi:MAG: ribonuclease P protein component [Alloprevotella sp.]|nr:ribonuclease P protein component [Alloprevotella sp.]